MLEAFTLMLWPLLACFVLVGIHAYLGIHVIARKVIFVDLALAQIAALGAVYGVFIGLSLSADGWMIKAVSVSFTLIGALLFSFTRTPDERVPHEAIIGIIYAAALSMTLLLTANLPHGSDEVSQLLSGNILWVTPSEVLSTAALYAVVGLIHIMFRRQFFLLSGGDFHKLGPAFKPKLWDFLFYATFGVVVTSSVGMGGVLLVFAYLVIPSVIGIMLGTSTASRLIIAWTSGLLISFIGVVVSYYLDLPSGPTIVVGLGLLLVSISLLRELRNPHQRRRGLIHGALVVVLISVVLAVPVFFVSENGHQEDHAQMHHNASNDEVLAEAFVLLGSPDDKKRVVAIETLKKLADKRAIPVLKTAANNEGDPFIVIDIALVLTSLHDKEGLKLLHDIIEGPHPDLAKEDAFLHIKEWLPKAPADVQDFARWFEENYKKIHFDERINKFSLSPLLND